MILLKYVIKIVLVKVVVNVKKMEALDVPDGILTKHMSFVKHMT